MTTHLQPSLFVSHGSPTFALESPESSVSAAFLQQFSAAHPLPRGIVVLSPHWQTRGQTLGIACGDALTTVHDFGGFPAAMYELQYPAKGSLAIAEQVSDRLIAAGFTTALAPKQGLDHGAWVPLMKLYPQAEVPVVQLSLPAQQTTAVYYALGQALGSLREQGLMIVASGSLTHNLYEVRLNHAANAGLNAGSVAPYVLPFRQWMQDAIAQRDLSTLLNYRALAPFAAECHPTDEHLMPLFVALGAGDFENPSVAVDYFAGELAHFTLAMDHVVLQAQG